MRALTLAAILALTVAAMPFAVARAAGSQGQAGTDLPQRADSSQPPATRALPFPPGFGSFGTAGPQSRARGGVREPTASEPAPSKSAAPRPAPPKTRAQLLDDLFTRLAQTSDTDEAKGIARAIERIWMHSGSDTADLLMSRAVAALGTENYGLAEKVLNAVVVIAPDWAEGWDRRATARFFADNYAGAMEDISHVLAIEPRHFGALSGMGFILEKSGLDKEALQVFRKTLEIYPQQDSIRKIVDGLALKIEGRDI